MTKGKTTDGLMRHLRDNNKIDINGSKQKKELLNMGYYHGYKGYRFIKTSANQIPYTQFDEVTAIYNFDTNIKTLFYPLIMNIETAVKNYTLDTIISFGDIDLENCFEKHLTDYKYAKGHKAYKDKLKETLKLRSKINQEISIKYGKNIILEHFLHNGQPIPLWAIFEIIDMGTFGMFLKCLNEPIRISNCKNLDIIYTGIDPHGLLVQNIIFFLKSLRNAIAHNNVVFDCRFQPATQPNPYTGKLNHAPSDVRNYIEFETKIPNIDFTYLVDYLILNVVILKKLGKNKTQLKKVIRDFKDECEVLRTAIPTSVWHKIVGTDIAKKISLLENYL